MNNWWARIIIFLLVGAGSILSWYYTTSHFKPDRQIIILNRTIPDFHKFLDIDKHRSTGVPKSNLKAYFDYFQLVTEAMPDNSDGALMLGYLYAVTGRESQAGILFKAAHRLEAHFFFTEFNLGLFLFKQGDYAQSAEILQKALMIPPQETANRMMNSMVYRQILASGGDHLDVGVSLQQSYHDAYIIMMESLGHRGENANIEVHARIL
jgi:tetratricopeptide (TPR) repeat protein